MSSFNLLLIIAAVLIIAIGQLIFKFAALNFIVIPGHSYVEFVRYNIFVISLVGLALILYALSTVAWLIALRTVPLSVAYLFNGLAFVIVPIAAVIIYGEILPRYFYLGSLMTIAGVVLVTIR